MALMRSTGVCGASVVNRAGESVGTVTDLMLDTGSGRVAYVVVAHGGVLGVGEKLFAVPWEALEADPREGRLVVDATPEALDAAAGIDKDAWPREAPREWLE